MKSFQTQGILIHKFTVGENDTLATWYTREHGRIRTKVRGAKKINSKFTGHLEYLNLCELTIHRGKSNLILTECQLTNPFQQIKNSLPKLDQSFDIIKLINAITYEEENVEDLYTLTTDTLKALATSQNPPLIAEHFKLNLLFLMGLIQDVRECAFCNSKLSSETEIHLTEKGSLVCHNCRSKIPTLTQTDFINLKIIHFFSITPATKITNLKLTPTQLTDFQKLIHQLFSIHFPFALK